MNAAAPAIEEHKLLSVLGLAVCACGYVSQLWIEALGQLFWAEVALPAIALALVLGKWPQQLVASIRFRVLTIGLLLMLVGYVVSDLKGGTAPGEYLRGWSRVTMLAIDALSLAVIYDRNRWSLWWFWLGSAIYGLQVAVLSGIPLTYWKFGYAEPITTGAMNASALLPGWLSAAAYLVLGAASIVLDYRSLGALLLIAGAILLMSASGKVAGLGESIRLRSKILVVTGIAGAATLAIALLLHSNEEFAQRRDASNIGRFAALKIALVAIAESPVIGYGSWGNGTEKFGNQYVEDTFQEQLENGTETGLARGTNFLPHSQILQAWMEGGMLAAFFFIAYGWYLLVTIRDLAFAKTATRFRGFLLALLLLNLWHLVMSPFLGGHRLDIASTFAMLVCALVPQRIAATNEAVGLRPITIAAPQNLMR
jgi:hypothetical protein